MLYISATSFGDLYFASGVVAGAAS